MSEDKDQEKKAAEDKADVEITEDSKEEPKEKKPDKKALEKERKEIIQKMLRIQKEFMEIEAKLHLRGWEMQLDIENLGFKLKLI